MLYRLGSDRLASDWWAQRWAGPDLPAAPGKHGLHTRGLLLVQHKHEHAILARGVVLAQQLIKPPIPHSRVQHLHHLAAASGE